MSTKRKVLSGSKVAATHSTLIGGIAPLIETAKRSGCVTRVVTGANKNVGSNQPRIRFKEVSVGLKVIVYSSDGIQALFLHTKHPETVREVIRNAWDAMH